MTYKKIPKKFSFIFRTKFKNSKKSPLKMRQLQDDIVARRRASRMEPEPFNEEDECK